MRRHKWKHYYQLNALKTSTVPFYSWSQFDQGLYHLSQTWVSCQKEAFVENFIVVKIYANYTLWKKHTEVGLDSTRISRSSLKTFKNMRNGSKAITLIAVEQRRFTCEQLLNDRNEKWIHFGNSKQENPRRAPTSSRSVHSTKLSIWIW